MESESLPLSVYVPERSAVETESGAAMIEVVERDGMEGRIGLVCVFSWWRGWGGVSWGVSSSILFLLELVFPTGFFSLQSEWFLSRAKGDGWRCTKIIPKASGDPGGI